MTDVVADKKLIRTYADLLLDCVQPITTAEQYTAILAALAATTASIIGYHAANDAEALAHAEYHHTQLMALLRGNIQDTRATSTIGQTN